MKRLIISVIKFYKNNISIFLGRNCRFSPTCSEYLIESIEKYGIFTGVFKGAIRLLKCNPFYSGGYDPV